MVDPNSPAFNYSEKIGLLIGKGIRYIVVSGLIIFLSGKLSGSRTYPPAPNPTGPGPSP